jgi:hypothetical protein
MGSGSLDFESKVCLSNRPSPNLINKLTLARRLHRGSALLLLDYDFSYPKLIYTSGELP